MNLIQQIEAENIAKAVAVRPIPQFRAGDTLRVGVKVVEGERTRVQNYEGVCIARSNCGMVFGKLANGCAYNASYAAKSLFGNVASLSRAASATLKQLSYIARPLGVVA
jgi:ribosomal protein L19